MGRCDGVYGYSGDHEHAAKVSHAHLHGSEVAHNQPSPADPTIHCPDVYGKLAFAVQTAQQFSRQVIVDQLRPMSSCSFFLEDRAWVTHSEVRPPGPLPSNVASYLSLSVLRL